MRKGGTVPSVKRKRKKKHPPGKKSSGKQEVNTKTGGGNRWENSEGLPLCETVQKGGLGRLGVAEVKGTIVGSGSGVPADGVCRLRRDNLGARVTQRGDFAISLSSWQRITG